jgi:hypothetical protein
MCHLAHLFWGIERAPDTCPATRRQAKLLAVIQAMTWITAKPD